MAVVTPLLTNVRVNNQTLNFGPLPFPYATHRGRLVASEWPAGVQMLVHVEFSFDNGATWPSFIEATWRGGLTGPTGAPCIPSLGPLRYARPGGTPMPNATHVRGWVQAQGTWTTSLTWERD